MTVRLVRNESQSPPRVVAVPTEADFRTAMRARAAATALALLEQLATHFPAGMLREERDATRVLALCGLGRRADAVRAADGFFVTYEHSPYAARVRSSCVGETP